MADIPTKDSDMGLKVNVGIRPEDMALTAGENYAYEAKVEISEALGEVTQVYFAKPDPNNNPVIAKLPGIHRNVRGNLLRMTADPAKLHLFSNGRSLLYR